MRKATQSAVTVYVVLQDPKGDPSGRPDQHEAHSFPVNFLVFARNKRHAIARVECELGRAVLEPVVMPLSRYRSWTHTGSRGSGSRSRRCRRSPRDGVCTGGRGASSSCNTSCATVRARRSWTR